ncbi:response regulator transcription factor [Chryseobacterium arachidis]|nr:response regulator [Chryseobacterium arachidis]
MVEDNQDIREILTIFLTAEGYRVLAFGNVKEFKKRNTEIFPDLYLFDVMLPDGSGIDLCNEIKSQSNNKVPVIIMSANVKIDQTRKLCMPDDYISKPFDLNDLLQKIRKITL